MKIVLSLTQQQKDNSIELNFGANLNKHNKDVIMGTLANEVCEGLGLLKRNKCKGQVKSNDIVDIKLKMGNDIFDTKKIAKWKGEKGDILKTLRMRLRLRVGNPAAEAAFFSTLWDICDYMVRDIKKMTWAEFVAGKAAAAEEIKTERALAKEAVTAVN